MESGDSSDVEAPPSIPNRKDPTIRKEWLKAVSMLNSGYGHHQKIWHGTLLCLSFMGESKSTLELGIINSPEYISCKKLLKQGYEFVQESVM